MRIYVKLGEPLWRTTGHRRLELVWPTGAEATVAGVLARLAAEYPAFAAGYAAAPYRLFVDARPTDAIAAPLAAGQTLFILLPAIGG